MPIHPIEYRYRTEEMSKIWSEEHKLEAWLKVEAALAKAHAKLGNIPLEASKEISEKANLNYVKLERVKEIEAEIHHDLMAMVKALTEVCSEEAGKYVHLGATSYDIEDTALALLFKESISIIEKDLIELKETLLNLAETHKETICIGRTHGQHAVPTTYGLKFAVYACEVQRHIERLNQCKERVLVGKMSGAVGTGASFKGKSLEIQKLVMEELGLKPVLASTQIVQRDRHAELIFNLALIATTLEKIAKEIRNLQRTEIAEVSEFFAAKQVGSSTMPHKRNPHKSERICGLARIVKALVYPALDNNPLEHERDLTNSAPERIIFPEAFILVDYMMKQMNSILKTLVFYPKNIERNLNLTKGLIMAEHLMIKLVEKNVGRQEAHELLRKSTIKAFNEDKPLKDVLLEEGILKYLTEEELDYCLNPRNYIGEAEKIVNEVIKVLRQK
ncbi:MAG: adenylosuccinate lyase [Candidatus Bathyarchaeia archaeon]